MVEVRGCSVHYHLESLVSLIDREHLHPAKYFTLIRYDDELQWLFPLVHVPDLFFVSVVFECYLIPIVVEELSLKKGNIL